MVVREGCTLTAYDGGPFKGKPRDFTGVIKDLSVYGRGFLRNSWNDELSAYSCACTFGPIDCTPTAKWERIISCDNKDHGNPTKCTYQLKEGLSIGKSVTRGGSVSSTVSATISSEMGVTFAEIGSVSASSSVTESFSKEYNWARSSSIHKSATTLKKVEMTADPGKTTELYQIVGRCGDSAVFTEEYKIVSV
ncbi:uncharacterized protein LOC143028283 [Oratosquilla oratoria]|uniref:uncharacterized protein LOC143028283 n=1 Tax=Oratosquilla oratoria TaxID=337810 RepID=UPI003F77553E